MNTPYIRHAIKKHFKKAEVDEVFALLRAYDEWPRPDFTYYAVLRYVRGDKALIRPTLDWVRANKPGFMRVAERAAGWRATAAMLESRAAGGASESRALLEVVRRLAASHWSWFWTGHPHTGLDAFYVYRTRFAMSPFFAALAPPSYPPDLAVQISYYHDMTMPGSYRGAGRDVTPTQHGPGVTNIETIQCPADEAYDNISMHLANYTENHVEFGPL